MSLFFWGVIAYLFGRIFIGIAEKICKAKEIEQEIIEISKYPSWMNDNQKEKTKEELKAVAKSWVNFGKRMNRNPRFRVVRQVFPPPFDNEEYQIGRDIGIYEEGDGNGNEMPMTTIFKPKTPWGY